MGEESKSYCHKFNRSQSNRVPVDCLISFQWVKVPSRQWPQVPQWLDLLLARAVAQDWLSGSHRPGFVNTSGIPHHV